MNICPHCQAKANPLFLLLMTRRAPYKCGRCDGKSLLRPKDNTLVAIITLIVVVFCAVLLPTLGIAKTLALFICLYVFVVGGIMWLFMRLNPIQKEQ